MLSGKAGYPEYPRPLTEWETRRLPLHSVKMPLDSIRMIRIGMKPKGKNGPSGSGIRVFTAIRDHRRILIRWRENSRNFADFRSHREKK